MSARRPESFESRGRRAPESSGKTSAGSESPAGSRVHNSILMRRPSLMQEPVLVLNATYEPINVTAVRRAMVLLDYVGNRNLVLPREAKIGRAHV